jgi:sulfur carrier protein
VTFQLNGEAHESDAPLTVRALLERMELGTRRVAVAINACVVPKSRFEAVQVREGDHVEVIHAVGGG